ncbi:class I poly(R)-hydroxyalkanoic acid synthase, partial [Rhizobium leguminosarum]
MSLRVAGFDATDLDPYLLKDPEAMAMNFERALENIGQAASAWLAPRERGEISESAADPMTDMVKTLSKVTEYWISDP